MSIRCDICSGWLSNDCSALDARQFEKVKTFKCPKSICEVLKSLTDIVPTDEEGREEEEEGEEEEDE